MGKYLDLIGQGEVIQPQIEPAAIHARPVYWEAEEGRIIGPAVPESVARVSENGTDTYWVIVTYEGTLRWIRNDRLRSKRDFEAQPARHHIESIRTV